MLHDIQRVKYLAASALGKLSEIENAPSCVYWHVQNEPGHAPGAKPVVYRPLDVDLSPELPPRGEPCETKVATEVEMGEIVYARFLKPKLILMQSYHADEIFAFIPFRNAFVLFVSSKGPVDNFVGAFVCLSFSRQRLNPLGRWNIKWHLHEFASAGLRSHLVIQM